MFYSAILLKYLEDFEEDNPRQKFVGEQGEKMRGAWKISLWLGVRIETGIEGRKRDVISIPGTEFSIIGEWNFYAPREPTLVIASYLSCYDIKFHPAF